MEHDKETKQILAELEKGEAAKQQENVIKEFEPRTDEQLSPGPASPEAKHQSFVEAGPGTPPHTASQPAAESGEPVRSEPPLSPDEPKHAEESGEEDEQMRLELSSKVQMSTVGPQKTQQANRSGMTGGSSPKSPKLVKRSPLKKRVDDRPG